MTNEEIRDFDPAAGMAFQGDVAIIPVPDGIGISEADEIAPVAGRLILQAGEVTGHHHAITVDPSQGRSSNFRRETAAMADVVDPFAGASPVLHRRLSGKRKAMTARMFRDRSAADAMIKKGILTRSDLCVGFLKVEGGPAVVRHEEHAGIRLPMGSYYVGRQVESAGAEERRVAD